MMQVVFIHGPAAAGKYTVGKELAELTGLPLFHNHLTVDTVGALFDFGTPGFVELREEIWISAFRIAAEQGKSFIFTFNPERTVEPTLIVRLDALVRKTGGKVHFVELTCPDAEILKRIDSAQRRQFQKLTDGELYQKFKADGGFEYPALLEPIITLDTSQMSPQEAAAAIQKALEAL